MSTIFMGKSSADELAWRDIPMSADPALKFVNVLVQLRKKRKNNREAVGNPLCLARR